MLDEDFMLEAYAQALLAFECDETPVGCVIVKDGLVIARGHNLRNTMKNSLYHAELLAIDQACRCVGDWRLEGCDIFVTVEPCPMCAGAIVQARMDAVVFGAANRKAGCGGSVLNLFNQDAFNHRPEVRSGVLGEQCGALMSEFFKRFRR